MARILLVNDEPDLLLLCQMVLEGVGHSVETLTQSSIAFDVARRVQPGLIGLDWVMPELDGEQLLGRLKSAPETRSIPVLVISALEGLQSYAQRLGADGFLQKPFDPDDLVQAVHGVLRSGAAQAMPPPPSRDRPRDD